MNTSRIVMPTLLLLAACGAASVGDLTGSSSGLTVSPGHVAMAPQEQQVFTATPASDAAGQAAPVSIQWVVKEGASGGTISSAGLYTAPGSTGTFHVVATSATDPGVSATAEVSVSTPAVTISVSPTRTTLSPGGAVTFACTVKNAANSSCSWSVKEGADHGTITAAGVYTAPAGNTTATVVAVANADTSKTAAATVQVGTAIAGTWTNVTPSSLSLDPNGTSGGTGNNFGVNAIVVHPTQPNVLYVGAYYQGIWKSTDYGATWAKVSTGTNSDAFTSGRPWSIAIAPDGGYMLSCSGYGKLGIYRSTDGGVNWSTTGAAGLDVSGIAISQAGGDGNHAVALNRTNNHLLESVDGGLTWRDQGTAGADDVFFFLDPGTLLAVGGGDNGSGQGTRRGVRSGTTWPWSWSWTRVDNQQHWHGGHQIFVDPDNAGTIYNSGPFGVHRSTDSGRTWTSLSSTWGGVVIGTAKALYSTADYALSSGSFDPHLQTAARDGSGWAQQPAPAAFTGRTGSQNGWHSAAVTYDGKNYILVGANWMGGITRLVEP